MLTFERACLCARARACVCCASRACGRDETRCKIISPSVVTPMQGDAEDPWAPAREALASAGSQAAAAALALASVATSLAHAAAALASATATSAYRAIEPPVKELAQSFSTSVNELVTNVAHPDFAPATLMYLLTFAVLYLSSFCCWRPGLLKLSCMAAALAVPQIADASIAAAAAAVAIALANPTIGDALTAANATLQSVLVHPHAAAAAALASAARNASMSFASSAYEIVITHPHVGAASSHPNMRVLLDHPHVAVMREHPHAPRLAGWLGTILLSSASIGLLRCCCCCGGGDLRGLSFRQRHEESDAEAAARRAAKKERQKESRRADKEKLARVTAKKGGLRGVAEASLRDPTEGRVGAMDIVLGPPRAVSRICATAARLMFDWTVGVAIGPRDPSEPESAAAESQPDAIAEQAEIARPEDATSRAATGGRPSRGKAKKEPVPLITHPRLLVTLKGFAVGESVTSAALSQDGTLAAAVSTDRTLRIFPGLQHAGTGTTALPAAIIANVPLDHGTAVSLSSNGRNVVLATCQARKVLAYSIMPKLAVKRSFPDGTAAAHPQPMCAALIAPNSKFILTAGGEGDLTAKLWSISGELIATFEASKHAALLSASISADSKLIALACTAAANPTRTVAAAHGQVPVLEVQYRGGEAAGLGQVLSIGGHTRGMTSAAFAQDCVHLGLASHDGEWSVVSTDVRYDLKVPAKEKARGTAPNGAPFERVALSPFARRLVGSTRTTMVIVDVEKQRVLETIDTGHGGISCLQYSSDGLRVLTAGSDGRLRLWRVEDDDGKAGTL